MVFTVYARGLGILGKRQNWKFPVGRTALICFVAQPLMAFFAHNSSVLGVIFGGNAEPFTGALGYNGVEVFFALSGFLYRGRAA